MSWEQLAHSHEAQVGKIRLLIGISIGQAFKLIKVLAAVELEGNQPLTYHRQGDCGTLEVKRRLSQDGLACQEWR